MTAGTGAGGGQKIAAVRNDGCGRTLLVFLHPYFQGGGVEKSILRLSKVARGCGYDCEVLTIHPSGAYAAELERVGVRLVDLGAGRMLGMLRPAYRYLREQTARYDRVILVANQSYVNIAAVGLRLFWRLGGIFRRRKNWRLILSERLHFNEIRFNCGALRGWLIPQCMKLFYRYADAVFANSSGLARDVQALTGTPCVCSFNPTLDDRVKELALEPLEHRWFDGGHRVIMGAGRLEKVKGFSVLIDAFARIAPRFPDVRLVILGEGKLRGELQAQIDAAGLGERVELAGFQENPYRFMSRAAVYVLSSYYEGLPNTLIEALICGCPALSANCPSGPEDILLGGKGGELLPVGDAGALAAGLERYLADPEYARRLWRAAAEGLTRFEQQTAGEAFLRIVDPDFAAHAGASARRTHCADA